VYNFEMADVDRLRRLFDEYEAECKRLQGLYAKLPSAADLLPEIGEKPVDKRRFPVLPMYEQVLKCSNLFNLLDARGAISVTERVGVIKRVRDLAVGTAKIWVDQQGVQEQGIVA
jgi:glycyl-tRNA synthetase alpha chain